MVDKYIHIGYPKNLSTTLQVDHFSKHPDLYHLGTGISHNTGYIDSSIESYFENIFFYANKITYRNIKNQLLQHLEHHYKLFKKSKKQMFGFSLEHISFSFTPADTDIYLKFKRIFELFGKDVILIVFIRNQVNLIKSLYRESIRIGYPGNFQSYLYFLYVYQNYSFIHELQYDRMLDLLSEFFHFDNIHIFPIESYLDDNGDLKKIENNGLLIHYLNYILNVRNFQLHLYNNNKSLSESELFFKNKLNKIYRHEFGKSIFNCVQKHRLKEYYIKSFHFEVKNIYSDVKIKRCTTRFAKILALINKNRSLKYDADIKIKNDLETLYNQSNKRLTSKYNIHLPYSYYECEF